MADIVCGTPAVNIKDYIINMDDSRQNHAVSYEVVLENNTDFIIRRQTKTLQRELVVLISQGLFYIRDCKSGTNDPITSTNLRSFFREMKDREIEFEQVKWINVLSRYSLDHIITVIENEVLMDMCRYNVPIYQSNPCKYVRYWEQNKRLFVRISQIFPKEGTVSSKYESSLPAIFWVEEHYGANDAMYFAERLVQSGIRGISYGQSYYYGQNDKLSGISDFTAVLTSDYNINFRRFVDFICFDLYRQGYGVIDYQFFREYLDYLKMQMRFHGKIKEKYPDSFKTAHDVIALKVNQMLEAERCVNFAEQVSQIKGLEYDSQGYCIVVPTEPRELADEGINLSHCVGSYIDRVASGECHILFLRRKHAPEQSLVTLQLCGKHICQAQGVNRRNITEQERAFLQRWGREKDIEIAV